MKFRPLHDRVVVKRVDEEGKTIKKDETEELKNDDGVVMVESRAAHLSEAQQPAEGAGAASEDGDLVKLDGKPKKSKKKPRVDRDL